MNSGMYVKLIQELLPDAQVIGKACPLFVPLVEEGFKKHHVTDEIIDYYLASFKDSDIDALILGCTHYPLLRSKIREYVGEKITLPTYVSNRKGFDIESGVLKYTIGETVIGECSPQDVLEYQLSNTYTETIEMGNVKLDIIPILRNFSRPIFFEIVPNLPGKIRQFRRKKVDLLFLAAMI